MSKIKNNIQIKPREEEIPLFFILNKNLNIYYDINRAGIDCPKFPIPNFMENIEK